MKKIISVLSFLILLIIIAGLVIPYFIKPISKVEVDFNYNASKHDIYNYLNDIKKFNTWNYWAVKDSSVKITYFHPYEGIKSSFNWNSKLSEIGKGTYKIIKNKENKYIESNFYFDDTNKVVKSKIFIINKSENKTTIKWIVHLPKPSYLGRIYNIYVENFIEEKIKFSLENLNKLIEGNLENDQFLLKNKGKIIEQNIDLFYIIGTETLIKDSPKDIFLKINEEKLNIKKYIKDSLNKNDKLNHLYVVYKPVNQVVSYKSKRKKIINTNNYYSIFIGYKVIDTIKLNKNSSLKYKEIPNQKNLVQFYHGNFYEKTKYKDNFENYYLTKGKIIKNYYIEQYVNMANGDSLKSLIKVFQPINK